MGRVFLRGIESQAYGLKEEMKRLRSLPRVIKGKALTWYGGAQHWNKNVFTPETELGQSIFVHIEELVPHGRSTRHYHQNEAMFYILEGKGHDVHDGVRYDWEAGDVCIVHNGCIHQHFNDGDRPARMLIIKTKPLFMFLHLIFQGTLQTSAMEPIPGWEGYSPPDGPVVVSEELMSYGAEKKAATGR
ncbi:MAG: cupin domain-containing protein [Deltaproteobacteria bacterium]|nr:cupin domain-containing protein [Deltaproteobacteria bacterium]